MDCGVIATRGLRCSIAEDAILESRVTEREYLLHTREGNNGSPAYPFLGPSAGVSPV